MATRRGGGDTSTTHEFRADVSQLVDSMERASDSIGATGRVLTSLGVNLEDIGQKVALAGNLFTSLTPIVGDVIGTIGQLIDGTISSAEAFDQMASSTGDAVIAIDESTTAAQTATGIQAGLTSALTLGVQAAIRLAQAFEVVRGAVVIAQNELSDFLLALEQSLLGWQEFAVTVLQDARRGEGAVGFVVGLGAEIAGLGEELAALDDSGALDAARSGLRERIEAITEVIDAGSSANDEAIEQMITNLLTLEGQLENAEALAARIAGALLGGEGAPETGGGGGAADRGSDLQFEPFTIESGIKTDKIFGGQLNPDELAASMERLGQALLGVGFEPVETDATRMAEAFDIARESGLNMANDLVSGFVEMAVSGEAIFEDFGGAIRQLLGSTFQDLGSSISGSVGGLFGGLIQGGPFAVLGILGTALSAIGGAILGSGSSSGGAATQRARTPDVIEAARAERRSFEGDRSVSIEAGQRTFVSGRDRTRRGLVAGIEEAMELGEFRVGALRG